MATISTPYGSGITDGPTLDVAGLNADLTADALLPTRRGVLSEPNGGIEAANLDASFLVTQEMIQPGEVADSYSYGYHRRLDYFSDLAPDLSVERYIPLAFGAATVELPYDCSLLLFDLHVFHSQWRLWRRYDQEQGGSFMSAEIITRIRVNGMVKQETRRPHAPTVYISAAQSLAGAGHYDRFEHYAAGTLSQHYAMKSPSAGVYDISIEVFLGIPTASAGDQLKWPFAYSTTHKGDTTSTTSGDCYVFSRFSTGAVGISYDYWK